MEQRLGDDDAPLIRLNFMCHITPLSQLRPTERRIDTLTRKRMVLFPDFMHYFVGPFSILLFILLGARVSIWRAVGGN